MLAVRFFLSVLILSILCSSFGLLWGINAYAEDSVNPFVCLTRSSDEGSAKDCCDSLVVNAATRKSCRDVSAAYDFSINSDVIPMNAPSQLGPDGDYSAALKTADMRACKEYCDGSDLLLSGDRHYCRNACNAAYGNEAAHQKPKTPASNGLPPEIVAACQGKSELDVCQVGDEFTATCHTLEEQLACLLNQDEADSEQQLQWSRLDGNSDGFLDVNEVNGVKGNAGSKGSAADNS